MMQLFALAAAALLATASAGEAGSLVQCLQWSSKLQEMQRVCCQQPEDCANGYPTHCTQECAGVMSGFLDDCEGMFDYLGLSQNPLFDAFLTQCEDLFNPSGMASCGQDGCDDRLGGLAQWSVSLKGVDLPEGAVVQVCGSFNAWCSGRPQSIPTLQKLAYPANSHVYSGQLRLPQGTWEYKYRYIVPATDAGGGGGDSHRGTWEHVQEACGVPGPYGTNRVLTIVTGEASWRAGGRAIGVPVPILHGAVSLSLSVCVCARVCVRACVSVP
eukprot:SAG22_NODE_2592_length_2407_cov_1.497834_1_plen_271_part_00